VPHIKDIPLEKWPPGWLRFQVASLMGSPDYLIMTDSEKRKAKLPISFDEMREYIKACRDA
jgi:hypothetical protein